MQRNSNEVIYVHNFNGWSMLDYKMLSGKSHHTFAQVSELRKVLISNRMNHQSCLIGSALYRESEGFTWSSWNFRRNLASIEKVADAHEKISAANLLLVMNFNWKSNIKWKFMFGYCCLSDFILQFVSVGTREVIFLPFLANRREGTWKFSLNKENAMHMRR